MSRKNNRANALLIEMLIVVLFFALASTVLVRVWAGARTLSARAGERSRAIAEAQSLAEELLSSGKDTLPENVQGFEKNGEFWDKPFGAAMLRVEMHMIPTGAGRMREGTISLLEGDQVLAQLDISRYLPKEDAL